MASIIVKLDTSQFESSFIKSVLVPATFSRGSGPHSQDRAQVQGHIARIGIGHTYPGRIPRAIRCQYSSDREKLSYLNTSIVA